MRRRISPLIASLPLLFCLCLQFTNATFPDSDTIRPGQSLNTSHRIVSANRRFALDFFYTENSTKYYVVIAYAYAERRTVWVANREHPFPNSSVVLTFNPDGNLVISDGRLLHVLTNTSGGNDTYARLLDTGNLILTNRALDVLWQSFDYPTDTLLPGMKIKYANDHRVLASWKSYGDHADPAPGLFSLQYLGSRKELVLMEGSEPYWTSSLSGVLADLFVIDGEYITLLGKSSPNEIRRIVLDIYGTLVLKTWMEVDQYWYPYNLSTCGAYPVCGVFSICNETADADSTCPCLPGFKKGTTFAGCERKTDLQCSDPFNAQKDWFLPIPKVYLPMYPQRLHVDKASDCKSACFNNCSCTGYAYDQDHRCLVWDAPLLNLKHFSSDTLYKTEFYLKLAPPDFTKDTNSTNGSVTDPGVLQKNLEVTGNKQLWKIVVPTTSIAVVVTLGLLVHYVRRKLRRKGEDLLLLDLGTTQKANNSEHGDGRKREVQMPLFSFASVSAATNNFSAANKLGEGGFGPVYKVCFNVPKRIALNRECK